MGAERPVTSPELIAIARGLEAAFPLAQELGARSLRLDSACWVVETVDGETRRVAPDASPCGSSHAGAHPDVELHAAISAMIAASEVGPRILDASFDLDGGRQVVGAEFSLGGCGWYVFDPGYDQLPSGDSYTVTRIDDDRYELACPPLPTAVVEG